MTPRMDISEAPEAGNAPVYAAIAAARIYHLFLSFHDPNDPDPDDYCSDGQGGVYCTCNGHNACNVCRGFW